MDINCPLHYTGLILPWSICFCVAFHSRIPFQFFFWLFVVWGYGEEEYLYLKESWLSLRCRGLCIAPERKMDLSLRHKASTFCETLRLEAAGWTDEETHLFEPRTACPIDIEPNLVDR